MRTCHTFQAIEWDMKEGMLGETGEKADGEGENRRQLPGPRAEHRESEEASSEEFRGALAQRMERSIPLLSSLCSSNVERGCLGGEQRVGGNRQPSQTVRPS